MSVALPAESLPPVESADESAASFLPVSVHMRHPDTGQRIDEATSCRHAFTGDELKLAPASPQATSP